MNKFTLFAASLLMSASSYAEWVKPAAPAKAPLSIGTELYLYNSEADGFLVGANDWGTRASYSQTLGHKVVLEKGTVDGSYYITNYVLDGGMKDQWGYMFMDAWNAIYVDNTKEGKPDNQYTFIPEGDQYKIGLSSANATFNPTEYVDAFLCGIKTMNDTRLYVYDSDNTAGIAPTDCQGLWYFVSPANYEAYTGACAQYTAAVGLGESIETAKAKGVSTAEAEGVYNDLTSTTETLISAKAKLDDAIRNASFAAATLENPYTVNFWNFEDKDASAWNSTIPAQNKGADNGNNAADYSVTGIHYENWNPGNFTVGGKVSTVVTEVPAGAYRLSALAFTSSGTGLKLYAGKSNAEVATTQINAESPVSIYTFLQNEGQIEIGIEAEGNRMNWVGMDNVRLEYLGTGMDAYKLVVDGILANEPGYDENTYCDKALYAEYVKAKEAVKNAKTPEEIGNAFDAFDAVLAKLAPNVAAWKEYVDKVEASRELLDNTRGEGEDIDALNDYIEDEAAVGYNGHGGAVAILAACSLTNEQLKAEVAYLQKLYDAASASSMADGDDCTELVANANFADNSGWQGVAGLDIPAGRENFRVFQAWGKVADVHQNLTGLQNGIYELNLQGLYKTDNEDDLAKHQCVAYINGFETKIPAVVEGPNSAELASDAFAAGEYPVKVYGLVTDNTMRIGIANRLRTNEQGILWAGGVKLTFRAKNEAACAAMSAVLEGEAKTLENNYCGDAEIAALVEAVAGGDDPYESIKVLKTAIDNVKESTTLYATLNTAIAGLESAIENNPQADASILASAGETLAAAKAGYDAKSFDLETVAKAIEDVNAASTAVKIGKVVATEDNPVEMTSAIANNNFDPAKGDKNEKRIDGWVVSGALNGYKEYSCSFNKGTFDLHQDLSGLPKGNYKVTVHAYYRAGSYEEEEANISNPETDTHLMLFYAKNSQDEYMTAIMNLSEGSKGVTLPEGISTKTINGITVPDGTGASVKCYAAGLFLNELRFRVEDDGKATIGLKLDETIGTNDYTVVGEWKLWYMGDNTATEQDMTSLIVNNDFDPAKGDKNEKRIDGWVVSGALNGYKEGSCSFNKGTFDLHQDLSGLPAGKYKATVNTYYRAGSYEEEAANITSGKDTHLMKLYANTSAGNKEVSVMNLSEGSKGVTLPDGISTKEINGIIVPDGTGASVKCYAQNLFLNEIEFTVGEDGKATLGLKLDELCGTNDYTVVGPWHLYYYGAAQELTEDDMSSLIVNNDFDPAKGDKNEKRIDGWVVSGALNGYKENSCSFNKGTFDLHQDLSGLPEGTYKVTVHTYYRAGSYEEEAANINAGKDTHLMKLYANTTAKNYETSVMNLSEGSKDVILPDGIGTKEINGIIVPDGTGASVKCYAAGLFLNELPFYVSDGKATIGLRLPETIGTNDYTVVGKWSLYYYGSGNHVDEVTGIEEVEAAEVAANEIVPVAYYSIGGAKLAGPQKGINIILMSDGSVIKMNVR